MRVLNCMLSTRCGWFVKLLTVKAYCILTGLFGQGVCLCETRHWPRQGWSILGILLIEVCSSVGADDQPIKRLVPNLAMQLIISLHQSFLLNAKQKPELAHVACQFMKMRRYSRCLYNSSFYVSI